MALCDQVEKAHAEREHRRATLRVASLQRLTAASGAGPVPQDGVQFFLTQSPRLVTKPEHIAEVRQAILDLAVRGRLVPRGKAESHLASSEADARVLPVGWKWMRLGEMLAEESRNGYSRRPDNAPDGVPILRISAGTTRADLVVDEENHKLIGGVAPRERDRYSLYSGDLVACRFNGNRRFVGRVALFNGYLLTYPMYPDKLIRLRVRRDTVLPELIRWFAASTPIRAAISELSATTVGNWGISATNLKTVMFPVPPPPEQQSIVTKVEELMTTCDELERALVTARTQRGRLLEVLLHEALPVQ